MSELSGWANFYVIVGSSAGALIGLQFVVITLLAQIPVRNIEQGSAAFSTPTVVHFGATLLLAAVGAAPWQTIYPAAAHWTVIGVFGAIYTYIVYRRMHGQSLYRPVLEDWLFHVVLPFVSYVALPISATLSFTRVHAALYTVAGAAMLLLFVGIHNAWDAATYHVMTRHAKKIAADDQQSI